MDQLPAMVTLGFMVKILQANYSSYIRIFCLTLTSVGRVSDTGVSAFLMYLCAGAEAFIYMFYPWQHEYEYF